MTGASVRFIREDFPEPLTPVTTVSISRGISTSTLSRLFSLAPLRRRNFVGLVRASGIEMIFSPRKKAPVCVSDLQSLSNVPWKIICPQWTPAHGQMSTISSEFCMISSSCSTTITVFPRSTSSLRLSIKSLLSRA